MICQIWPAGIRELVFYPVQTIQTPGVLGLEDKSFDRNAHPHKPATLPINIMQKSWLFAVTAVNDVVT